MVWVQNQLELAPLGTNITLQCNTESFPPAIHYWTYKNGSAIVTGTQVVVVDNTACVLNIYFREEI